MQRESTKREIICQCCCQTIANSEKVLKFTEELVRLLTKLELSEFLQQISGFCCSRCHDKLKVIESFRIKIVESQENFRKMKQKIFDARLEVEEMKIDFIKKEESFSLSSINLLASKNHDSFKTERKNLNQITKQLQKRSSKDQE